MTKNKKTELGWALLMGICLIIASWFLKGKYLLALYLGLSFLCFSFFNPYIGLCITVFSFVFLPDILSLGLVLGFFVIYCFRKLLLGEEFWKPESQEIVMIVFVIYLIISTITSTYVQGSIRDLAIHAGGFALFVMILTEVKTKRQFYLLLSILALAVTFITLFGISQYFTGAEIQREWVDVENNPDLKVRIFSVFGNPNIFAEYLVMLIPISVGLMWATKKDDKRIFYMLQMGLGFIALVLTMSRGGWVGILAAACFFLFFVKKRLFLLGIPTAVGVLFVLPDGILNRLTSIFNFADSSIQYRFDMWRIILDIVKDHPFTGVGLGHLPFKRMFETYIRTMPIYHAHNTYLEILTELGILGFILFIVLLLTVFIFGYRRLLTNEDPFYQVIGSGLMAGLFGVLVHGMFENILYLTKITMSFWVLIALIFVLGRLAGLEEKNSSEVMGGVHEQIHSV